MRSACRTTQRKTARSSGTGAASWPRISRCRSCVPGGIARQAVTGLPQLRRCPLRRPAPSSAPLVAAEAEQAGSEAEFFTRLRAAGVLVRERFSTINPGEVTGYAVALPGCTGSDGTPRWYGGGRLHDSLTLPRLRTSMGAGRSREPGPSGAFRFTAPERAEIYRHAPGEAAVRSGTPASLCRE